MSARQDPLLNTFASGVLAPRLLGREDIRQYSQGLRHANNLIVMTTGGLTRRPGTYFVAEVKYSSKFTRLLSFSFSVEQTYTVEVGDGYMRFYANSGRLESPPGTPVEIVAPWEEADLPQLRWAQTADVMYLVHPLYMPRKLVRTGLSSFTLSTVSFSRGRAPLLSLNQDPDNYATVTGAWPNLTITMVKDTFVSGDVGRTFYIKSTKDKNAYYVSIAGFTNTKVVTATGIDRFSDTAGAPTGTDADRWAFGAMDATNGCAAVTFHEGRLVYGGFTRAPDMLYLSVSDDFDNFELSSPDAATTDAENDDKAIQRRAVSGQVNSIVWLASVGTQLVVGTSGAEFRLRPANDDILSPLSATLRPAVRRGCAAIQPAIIDNRAFYIDRSNAVLRQLKYDLFEDNYASEDVSIIADHLLLSGASEIVYQQAPQPLLWVLTGEGKLVGWSVEKDQDVLAAHPHSLGGSYLAGGAVVESMAVVQGGNMTDGAALEDQVWFVVKRTVNGTTKRYVEYLNKTFRPNLPISASVLERATALEQGYFLDCGLTRNIPIEITGISTAAAAVVTAPAHGLSNGDTVRMRYVGSSALDAPDAPGMTALFHQLRFTVSAATTDTFVPLSIATGLPIDTTGCYFTVGYVYKDTTTVTGLDHLEGVAVSVLVDGKVHPDRVVSGGAISLEAPGSLVHAGLFYRSEFETMPIALPSPRGGSAAGYPKQFGVIVLRLYETLGCELGRGDAPAQWWPLIFESTGNLMDYPPAMFTGDKSVQIGGDPEALPTIYGRTQQPLPFTLLALYPRAWSNAS